MFMTEKHWPSLSGFKMQTASQKYFKVKQVLNWANLLTTRKDVKEQMQPTPSSSSSHYSGLGWVGGDYGSLLHNSMFRGVFLLLLHFTLAPPLLCSAYEFQKCMKPGVCQAFGDNHFTNPEDISGIFLSWQALGYVN